MVLEVSDCRHCWHDTRFWALTDDGAIVVQWCCWCRDWRNTGLCDGLVIEGHREHGSYKPKNIRYRYTYRACATNGHTPTTPRRREDWMSGFPTISIDETHELIALGLTDHPKMRKYLDAAKKAKAYAHEVTEETRRTAKLCRRVLHNPANMARLEKLQSRAQAA